MKKITFSDLSYVAGMITTVLMLLFMVGDMARKHFDGCKFETWAEYLIVPYSLACKLTEKIDE